MPEPFAKARVALSHRTASWLPRWTIVSRECYPSCNHGTPHSHGPGLAKRNQQQSWSKPDVQSGASKTLEVTENPTGSRTSF